MPKRVLDVGNCSMDHSSIKSMIVRNFGAEVAQAHSRDDALERLRNDAFDLVLINRKLDQDASDGIEILKAIKDDSSLDNIPVMLISNFSEHQDSAVGLGALRGFGKKALVAPETKEKLAAILG